MRQSLTSIFDAAKVSIDPIKTITEPVKSFTIDSDMVSNIVLAALGYDGKIRKAPKELPAFVIPQRNLLNTAFVCAA